MEYKISSVETDFGKGTRIDAEGKFLEQIKCGNGLHARIYSNSLSSSSFNGTILSEMYKSTTEDYRRFAALAEGLETFSGEKIPHKISDFMRYLSTDGLKIQLSREVSFRINIKGEGLPEKLKEWAVSRSHIPGTLTSLLGIGAIGTGVFLAGAPAVPAFALTGIGAFFLEGLGGVIYSDMHNNDFWCGPLHAIGYAPLKAILTNKVNNPEYILNKFIKSHKKLEQLGESLSSLKSYRKQQEKTDRYFKFLEEVFTQTKEGRGVFLLHEDKSRDKIINDFTKILSFWNTGNGESKEQKENLVSQPLVDNHASQLAEVQRSAAQIAKELVR